MNIEIRKSSHVVGVPREMLLDMGIIEPTPTGRARAEEYAAEARQRADEREVQLDAARQRLAALTDPLTRIILDLHSEDESGECGGCDVDGSEAEQPEWPCRTVETIAAHHGIDLEWQP